MDSERSTAGLVVEIQWSEHSANSADFEERRAGVAMMSCNGRRSTEITAAVAAGPGDRWPTKDHHSWSRELQTHSASPVHGPTPGLHVCLRPRYLTERSGARVERAGRDAERGSGAGIAGGNSSLCVRRRRPRSRRSPALPPCSPVCRRCPGSHPPSMPRPPCGSTRRACHRRTWRRRGSWLSRPQWRPEAWSPGGRRGDSLASVESASSLPRLPKATSTSEVGSASFTRAFIASPAASSSFVVPTTPDAEALMT